MPAASMSNWLRVKEVLAAAIEASPDHRAALVDRLCAGDAELHAEVESLLQAYEASSFLEQPLTSGAFSDEFEPNIGRKLGPYIIEKAIGRGGMGTVYVARRADEEFERRVAIKMIRRGMDSEIIIRRFRHERQILASLDHPNIASLFDGGTTSDGLPYFVMEYVSGTPIDRYAAEHRLSTTARIELCLPILDAVQHAHDRHIVHRDIKPGNVMVSAGGHPKLLDFGIAKILGPDVDTPTTFSSVARPMTPDYASPEQLLGEPITAASDVYALGLLLYELVTGHRPFGDALHTPEQMARIVSEQDPTRPSAVIAHADAGTSELPGGPAGIDNTLDAILLKALRRETDRRYPSVSALADDLRSYLSGQAVGVLWDARRYHGTRLLRRAQVPVAVGLLIAVAAGTGLLVSRRRASSRTTAAVVQAAPRPSVAVIGFRNLSERPADGWLATAIGEMLTTELGEDGQLRVLPAERVSRVRGEVDQTSGAAISEDDVAAIRTALMSDYAVLGTLTVIDGSAPRALRVDVRMHRSGREPISVSGTGDEGQLFALVANLGRELRLQLGLREAPVDTTRSARAAFPQTLEATKLYAEGTARLRLLDAVKARELLEPAASREPDNPMIQSALASTWAALGYDGRAVAAAQKAFDSSGGLNREERLNVEGRLYEAQRKWPMAVEVYRTLWGFFSDNIEYGLRLSAAQTGAGDAKETLKTIEAMRRLGEPHRLDPRIDLEEAQAATALGDFPRESAAIQQALQRADRSGSRLLVARARLLEGRSYFNRGQSAAAQQSLDMAHQVFIAVGDRAGAASALNALGVVLGDNLDDTRPRRMLEQSLAISEEIGDRRGMAAALNNLGILLKDHRRYDEARRAHERALTLRREIADQNGIATSLGNIGVVLLEEDRLAEAAKYYRESLDTMRALGDRRGEVRALHNLAIVDRQLGNLAAARASYESSLATRAQIGDKRGGVMGRVELGMVLLAQGEIDLARKNEEEALTIAREIPLKNGEAMAIYQLGEIALASGDLAAARRLHEQALAMRRELNETRTVIESRIALAELAIEEGRIADAERDAVALEKELGRESDRALRIALKALLARARLAAGDVQAADRALAAARPLAAKTEQIEPRVQLALVESELEAVQGHNDRARTRLSTLRAALARTGMVLAELECRSALLRLDRIEGRATVRTDAATLRKDAQGHGAGLILRRIPTL